MLRAGYPDGFEIVKFIMSWPTASTEKPLCYISYGVASLNIKWGLRAARSSIVSANTPFAQANQLPEAILLAC